MDYGFLGIMDTIFPLMFGAVFLLIVGAVSYTHLEQLSVRLGAGGQLLCSVSYNIQF